MGLLLLFCAFVKAQTVLSSSLHSEKKYTARMAKRPIKVDGKLNEHDWKQAVLISNFEDIEGAAKPKPTFSTEVKMMWDSQYLYLLLKLLLFSRFNHFFIYPTQYTKNGPIKKYI